MTPNFIPISDEMGKRVYVLTGPTENGVVVFGNDYLLTFDNHNKLKEKKRLHANIIPIRDDKLESKEIVSTMHSHLSSTGDLMTATDICTLMLYCKYTKWKQHYVISPDYVSIWKCNEGWAALMTRQAWDKIGKEQKK